MRARNLSDLYRASVITARAFGKTALRAVLVWPILFLGMLGSWPFGRVYLSPERDGTVTIRPRGWRSLTTGAVWLVLVCVATGIIGVVTLAAGEVGRVALLVLRGVGSIIAAWIFLALIVLVIGARNRRGVSFKEVGPETPRGVRYSVTALAQLPGTSFSALDTAQVAISELPEASVAVACAANERLKRVYVERGGFTAGDGLRIYMVVRHGEDPRATRRRTQ